MEQIAVRTALVVLEEEREVEVLRQLLQDAEVSNIIVQTSGNAAWQDIIQQKIDLLVTGWNLSGVSGIALFNRFRQLPQHVFTPVMVVSEHLAEEDFSLLQELPCIRLLKKRPINQPNFDEVFQGLLGDATWYFNNQSAIENIIDFSESNGVKALGLLRTPLMQAPDPIPLALLVARKLREGEFIDEAIGLLEDILKRDKDCTIALSELGKSHFIKGHYLEATKYLDRAHSLSPKNVARLCLLGEIDLVREEHSEALSRFARALEIDPSDATSIAGAQMVKEANRARIEGRSGKLSMDGGSITHSLAGVLNMNAISLTRAGKFGPGIEAYNAALNLITRNSVRAKVAYNVGLAFMRWSKWEKALEWFSHSSSIAEPGFGKAAYYVTLMEEKIKALQESPGETSETVFDEAPSDDALGAGPTELKISQEEEEDLFG